VEVILRKLIPVRVAGNILLLAFGLLAIFHVLILAGIVPADIVWGGRTGDSTASILALEIFALVTTMLFGAIVAAKMGYMLAGRFARVITIGLWILFGYMLLNTVGNLAASTTTEKLFAPITIILALCALRLVLEETAL
jgi:hypothetical protein